MANITLSEYVANEAVNQTVAVGTNAPQAAAQSTGIIATMKGILFSPWGIVILIGVIIYYLYEEGYFGGKQKEFKPVTLVTIFKDSIDDLFSMIGQSVDLKLWHDSIYVGKIQSVVYYKFTANQYERIATQNSIKELLFLNQHSAAKRLEKQMPQDSRENYYMMRVVRPGFLNEIMASLGFGMKDLIIHNKHLTRTGNNLNMHRDVQLNTFGKIWVAGELEQKVIHDFAWRFLAESVIENQANLGRAITYYNVQHAMAVEKLQKQMEIERQKYQDVKEGKWF